MKDFQKLKEHIKTVVSLGEMLRSEGKITLEIEEEQISCPFHGVDNKKSARYYRDTDTFYCWVCRKVWDVFSYVQQKNGYSIKDAINGLIRDYRIDISSVPEQMDVFIQGITGPDKPVIIDRKNIFLGQVKDYIYRLRDKINLEKYKRLVHSYMLLRYMVPDDKFVEASDKMNQALTRITKEINNG